MATPAEMLRRIRAINLVNEVGDIVGQNLDQITALQKKQLMQGKDNKGQLFSPKHSENPFFKTPQAALNYAAWKQKITPETPFDVPNFYINGYYHSSISFAREGQIISAEATASFADKIDQEFNNSVLGLNPDSKSEAWNEIIRGPLVKELAGKIGCSVK